MSTRASLGSGLLVCAVTVSPPLLSEETITQCVGRFCFVAPVSMIRSADTYQVQGVTLEEVAWDTAADKPWEREWQARLARIEALKERREIPADRHGTILEQKVLAPGTLRVVLFNARGHEAVSTWGALLDAGPGGLWLQIDSSRQNLEAALARVREISSTYRVSRPGEAAPQGAFRLGRGYLAAPFKLNEEAHARFKGHPLGLDLSVTMETTFETPGLAERLASRFIGGAQLVFGGRVLGVKTESLRSRGRTVAGIRGDETIHRAAETRRGRLYFQWRTPGKEESGSHPAFTIEMETPNESVTEKIAVWDALLGSFQRAP